MTRAVRGLLSNALALPEDERIDLAAEILASVDGPKDPNWDAAWIAELDRRAQSLEQGQSSGADWGIVRARILERLASTH
jgi:putative addiction module component (TIGR02574 family)